MKIRVRNRFGAGVPLVLGAIVLVASAVGVLSFQVQPPTHTANARLLSIEPVLESDDACTWEPVGFSPSSIAGLDPNELMQVQSPGARAFAAFKAGLDSFEVDSVSAAAPQDGDVINRPPLRFLRDTDPAYTAVAVNHRTNEVLLQDSNLWSLRVFNRTENTPAGAARSEPKRVISGPKSKIQFNSYIYLDPKNGEIFTVENDSGDSVGVFAENASGDAAPLRKFNVGHRAYQIAVDEEKQEVYFSVQNPPQVQVYPKSKPDEPIKRGAERPTRILIGESTRMSDVHGIAIDAKNRFLYVMNWGHVSRVSGHHKDPASAQRPPIESAEQAVSSGRLEPASISVYPLGAGGDAPPARVIQGPKTQLNWAGVISVEPETGELYVANDLGQSILVFSPTAKGDVAPIRVIKGGKTGLNYPIGLYVDSINKELLVANFGNSSATVYPLNANGDVAPIRTIRSAPAGKVGMRLGKTNTVAYDSKREEYLVPNCVAHPQIAAFPRLGKENTPPTRALQGDKTLISRTMHALAYDPIHDEIVVTSPMMQGVLVFRGGANGEEPPLRYIMGNKTQIIGVADSVSVDPVNNEILVPTWPNTVLVFDREAKGNVAPKRVLYPPPGSRGPDPTTYQETGGDAYVDNVNNVLLVSGSSGIFIYDRTASGTPEPKAKIPDANGQFQITPSGWVLTACSEGNVCAYNLKQAIAGNARARWKLPVRQLTGGGGVAGMAIDAKYGEVMFASTGPTHGPVPTSRSVITTFSWPEVFEQPSTN